ncbi:MAG: hypothetical protein JXR70_09250 [Spirochaetales bacterium]|nr:hypothetical protein [Spirochaetales bacterium]
MPFFKAKCPLEYYHKEWAVEAGKLIFNLFNKMYLYNKPIILPDRSFFDWDYQADEEDADIIFEKICKIMDINSSNIKLMFYDGKPEKSFLENIPHHSQNEDGFAGLYHDSYSFYKQIDIEISLFKEPLSLVSTLAHELSHFKLLGEKRISNNDEELTDLLPVFFGLGIFSANSVIVYKKFQSLSTHGWSLSKKGYLSEPMFGFVLALWALYKNDDVDFIKKFLNPNVKSIFIKTIKYVTQNNIEYW